MSLKIVKRGRPSKADLLARQEKKPKVRSDSQILSDLKERFDILSLLTKGAVAQNIRAMVVTGAPGVGKTYTVEQILEKSNVPHEIVRGSLSAIHLYMLAYNYRRPGNVIVLDDADSIFNDEDALNILKALCDTSTSRKVSYMKEAPQLKEADIPQQFEFNGAMIFISNLDFQTFVDEGKNKYAQHFEALMSRSLYLDLRLHDRNELGVWVNHIANAGRIFDREDVPQTLRTPILNFLNTNRHDLRELSIRTLMKLCGLAKDNPARWESIARVLLTRT
jgi:Cdc6-like AAA superfamily ATPase